MAQISEVYETPNRLDSSSVEIEDEDGDDDTYETIEEAVRAFGRRHFGEISCPYLTPYLYNR